MWESQIDNACKTFPCSAADALLSAHEAPVRSYMYTQWLQAQTY